MNGLINRYQAYFEKSFVALCFFDTEDDKIKITACLCTENNCNSIDVTVDGVTYKSEFFYTKTKDIGEKRINFNYFTVSLDKECLSSKRISFEGLAVATFSAFPIDKKSASFYTFNSFVMYIDNDCLAFDTATKKVLKERKKARKTAMCQLFKSDRGNVIKSFIMRAAHFLLTPFFKKEIWLIADRKDSAGDNGEAFFEYICKNPQKNVKPYFVINKSSKDYKRIRAMGKVLHPRTFKYKLYYTFASKIIASQLEYDIVNPIMAKDYLKDITRDQKIVFLQHGIIKDDLSPTYNRYEKPMDIFVTSTNDEYKSIALSDAYGYGEKIVKLTGLARYDKLSSETEKIIFIAPSWRKNCLKDTNTLEPIDELEKTGFFKLYSEILSSKKLIDKASKAGYRLCFYPHTMMKECAKRLGKLDPVFVNAEDFSYNDMFKKGSLLLTDYSSVQFDFAYLKKPIIYCQPDRDEFFASHTYVPGYFDYEQHGFGPVTYSAKDAISLLCAYMENGCVIQRKYEDRIESTFKFKDKSNCQRILNEVLKLND